MKGNEENEVAGVSSPASLTVTPIFSSIPQVFFSFIYSTGISKMSSMSYNPKQPAPRLIKTFKYFILDCISFLVEQHRSFIASSLQHYQNTYK